MTGWTTIYTFTLPSEAYVVKGRLEAEGIPVFLKDEMTVQVHNFYSQAIGGVKLQIPVDKKEEAREILEAAGYRIDSHEDTGTLQYNDQIGRLGKSWPQIKAALIFLLLILVLMMLFFLLPG